LDGDQSYVGLFGCDAAAADDDDDDDGNGSEDDDDDDGNGSEVDDDDEEEEDDYDEESKKNPPSRPSSRLACADVQEIQRDLVERPTSSLSQKYRSIEARIKEVFDLPEPETFHGEYGCFLMRTVLLKGSLFLTSGHIGFYAVMAHEPEKVFKEGYLGKKTSKGRQYYKYWFILKGHVLSYYENQKDVYFPQSSIDLKNVLSVEYSKKSEKKFKIITTNKRHYFLAESRNEMVEWKKAVETAVFKAKNSAECIKIVIPLSSLSDASLVRSKILGDAIMWKTFDTDPTTNCAEEYLFTSFADAKKVFDMVALLKEKYDNANFVPETAKGSQHNTFTVSDGIKTSKWHGPLKASLSNSGSELQNSERSRFLHWGKSVSKSTISSGPSSPLTETSSDENLPIVDQLSKYFPGYFDEQRSTIMESFHVYLLTGYLPRFGRLTITDSNLFFNSKLVGLRTRAVFPLADIKSFKKVEKYLGFWYGVHITLKSSQVWLEFRSADGRSAFISRLQTLLDLQKSKNDSGLALSLPTSPVMERTPKISITSLPESFRASGSETDISADKKAKDPSVEVLLEEIHRSDPQFQLHKPAQGIAETAAAGGLLTPHASTMFPPVANDSEASDVPFEVLNAEKLKIGVLLIGTRGDIQPFIALCKGFIKQGHKCLIATHVEYKEWIESHGIEFKEVSGDPSELMQLCVDNGMFSISFLYEASSKFRQWFDELLTTAYEALVDSNIDLLVGSPVAMAGYHIAEKLKIPFFASFPMPWTRTREFSHPFAISEYQLGGSYNYMSWILMENVLWKGIQFHINKFRKKILDLPVIASGSFLDTQHVEFLYPFSSHVVKKPEDWKSWIHLPGYWYLDSPHSDWQPDAELLDFLNDRSDGKPIVYIGFGSIIVPDPDALTKTIVEAVKKAGVKAIVTKGWSSRKQSKPSSSSDLNSKDVLFLNQVPHDWLFPRIDAVVHHGGAGTAAAGLRFGRPTIIKPFFGDQYFWANRVVALNAGVALKKLEVDPLVEALHKVTKDKSIIESARKVGEGIRSEDGVANAMRIILNRLPVLRAEIQRKQKMAEKSSTAFTKGLFMMI
jgi:sterol 3beta-glucosyltransferase